MQTIALVQIRKVEFNGQKFLYPSTGISEK